MDITEYRIKLASIDPEALNFHAARYESGELFQEAIDLASCASVDADEFAAHMQAIDVATESDGGNPGTIPCLGGEPLALWNAWASVSPWW